MPTPKSKAEDPSKAALLARHLLEDIAARRLAEGDLYATEAQIQERHGVSRTLVREAVSRLQALGLLRGLQNKGLVIGPGNPLAAFSGVLPVFGRSSAANLQHLAQLRYALEVGAVDLAVRNRTDDQARRLTGLAEELARALAGAGNDPETRRSLDLRFHCLILEMTGNPMLAGMHQVLSEFFHSAYLGGEASPEVDARTVADHRALAEALADQDGEMVRLLIRRHLDEALEPGYGRPQGSTSEDPPP